MNEIFQNLYEMTAFSNIIAEPQFLIMYAIAFVLLYLGIKKQYEPLLLVPIAFGVLLANFPGGDMGVIQADENGLVNVHGVMRNIWEMPLHDIAHELGLMNFIYYMLIKTGFLPPIIFMGVGAMTDFGPLIANPVSLLLGAAAQFGIYVAFTLANATGLFTPGECAAIGIIGGADGPTSIYVSSRLLTSNSNIGVGTIALAAYTYMALVPIIQPPIMKALTTKKERSVVMGQLRPVSKVEKLIFPILVTIVISLMVPSAAPLVGMLMFGNLLKESGVCDRLVKTAQNELMNIITIFLGVTVGATTQADKIMNIQFAEVMALGVVAFSIGTACGVLLGKLMYVLSGHKINPLIGSAGVSAVPMAARISQKVGQQEVPTNYLLMHAMGPNVAGVIGSAVAAGVLLTIVR